MRGKVPDNYNFWVYTPGDYEEEGHPLPLVIFLHGASLCGRNLDRVRRYGVLDAIKTYDLNRQNDSDYDY